MLDITDRLYAILDGLPFASMDDSQQNDRRKRILDNVELLMHRLASLNDYLGQLLRTALPSTGKKNRPAATAKERLDAEVELRFKAPVNLVKHHSFSLRWIEAYTDKERTKGFFVSGIIGKDLTGPANHRLGNRAVQEGYSFAVILREALAVMFRMADITEQALREAGLFDATEPSPWVPDEAKLQELRMTLRLLNALPVRCFPNEHGHRALEYTMEGNAILAARTLRLSDFRSCRFSCELGRVEGGKSYRPPYWVKAA
jgi:hypothetical protein